jgi:hypothetical protein
MGNNSVVSLISFFKDEHYDARFSLGSLYVTLNMKVVCSSECWYTVLKTFEVVSFPDGDVTRYVIIKN